jgi:SPP1 family predicted phage head-tail adaptor
MNPGLFNKRITIESPPNLEETNENGFPIEDWQPVMTVWAMIKTLRSKEYYQAASIQAENVYRFVIRYRDGVNSDMRINYKGRIFEIISPPINDDEAGKTLTIMGRESV